MASQDTKMRPRPVRFRRVWEFPDFYRYKVTDPGLRSEWDRYPGAVIGAVVVVGGHGYGVSWARAVRDVS